MMGKKKKKDIEWVEFDKIPPYRRVFNGIKIIPDDQPPIFEKQIAFIESLLSKSKPMKKYRLLQDYKVPMMTIEKGNFVTQMINGNYLLDNKVQLEKYQVEHSPDWFEEVKDEPGKPNKYVAHGFNDVTVYYPDDCTIKLADRKLLDRSIEIIIEKAPISNDQAYDQLAKICKLVEYGPNVWISADGAHYTLTRYGFKLTGSL